MSELFYLWKSFSLSFLVLVSSLHSNDKLSSIHLPSDLDTNLPFQVHSFSHPNFTLKWSLPTKTCTVPIPINIDITLSQGQRQWLLKSHEATNIDQAVFQLWFLASANSRNTLWNEVPVNRLFLLSLLSIPVFLLSYFSKSKLKFYLPVLLLIVFAALPAYQNKLIVISTENWLIEQTQLHTWIKFENERPFSLMKLDVIDIQNKKEATSSLSGWLAPNAKCLDLSHQRWSSEHIITF